MERDQPTAKLFGGEEARELKISFVLYYVYNGHFVYAALDSVGTSIAARIIEDIQTVATAMVVAVLPG